MINIVFKDKNLKKIANDSKALIKFYGSKRAKKIMQRLGELRACENLGQMQQIPGARFHKLGNNRQKQYAVDLDHPYRMILEPQSPIASEPIDLSEVTTVWVLEIVDYH